MIPFTDPLSDKSVRIQSRQKCSGGYTIVSHRLQETVLIAQQQEQDFCSSVIIQLSPPHAEVVDFLLDIRHEDSVSVGRRGMTHLCVKLLQGFISGLVVSGLRCCQCRITRVGGTRAERRQVGWAGIGGHVHGSLGCYKGVEWLL